MTSLDELSSASAVGSEDFGQEWDEEDLELGSVVTSTPDGEAAAATTMLDSPIRGRPLPYGEAVLLPGHRNEDRAAAAARRRIVYSSEEDLTPPFEHSKKNAKWRDREGLCLKYVDDNLSVEKICMENAPSDGAGNRVKHAIPAQNKFRWVTRRAEERGMRVNTSKTAMTCISDAMSYKAEAYIEDADGGQIRSGPTMKVLGFHFSDRPTMHAHVQALQKRFRRQYWTLYHLRKAGFTNDELAKVYRTVILPLADYCQVIYHSMITDKQDQAIERLQARALKCIYGPYPSYAEMRKMAGVTTLRQRRIEACLLYTSPSPRDS